MWALTLTWTIYDACSVHFIGLLNISLHIVKSGILTTLI